MFYQESRSRAPSLSAHTPIFLFTYKPASVEHGSRHVLHVIVGEMEWNTGLGLRVQIAGFRVTRSRSQWRLVLPRCFLALWPWARDGNWESVARGWERKVRDRSKPWATMHPAPKDPGQAASAQPTAPTFLGLGHEPEPDPTVVCFTTLNHSWPSSPHYGNSTFALFQQSFYLFTPLPSLTILHPYSTIFMYFTFFLTTHFLVSCKLTSKSLVVYQYIRYITCIITVFIYLPVKLFHESHCQICFTLSTLSSHTST